MAEAGTTTAKKYRGSRRQRWRAAFQIVLLVIFPVIIWYFSPYLPYMGLVEGIVSGSVVTFAFLCIAAIPASRLFCGWLCPVGALQHFATQVQDRTPRGAWIRLVKYFIWFPWIGGMAALGARAISAGALRVDYFYSTEYGISVTRPGSYVIYLGVLALAFTLSIAVGKRGFCHTACWIAPFMVFGRGLGTLLRLPSLRLAADASACTSCATCDRQCPMGLPVMDLVLSKGIIAHRDCILCFQCADACPKKVITLAFSNRIAGGDSRSRL